MMRKSIRITVETDTLLVVHRAKAVSTWCPTCGAQVDAVTLTPDSFSEPATAAPDAAIARSRQVASLAHDRG